MRKYAWIFLLLSLLECHNSRYKSAVVTDDAPFHPFLFHFVTKICTNFSVETSTTEMSLSNAVCRMVLICDFLGSLIYFARRYRSADVFLQWRTCAVAASYL